MILNINDNKKFSKKSGDKNKIHINEKYAKKFFIKKPIVHGANVLIKAFKHKKFLKNKFNYLEIIFRDFININEKFKINVKKNYLLVEGSHNNKIEICKKLKKNLKVLDEKQIINELYFISKYIGNISPGPNSLIQQIKFISSRAYHRKKVIKKRKINENVIIIRYFHKNLITEIIALKLQPYKQQSVNNFFKKEKIIKSIKNKKIIIFGKNSDLGNFLLNTNLKKICKVKTLSSKNVNKNFLHNNLKQIKPDFIFYFFSPKIIHGKTKKIYDYYLNIYLNIPKKIFFITSKYKKKFKIFYPSTIFIEKQKKFKYLKAYINAKKRAEAELQKRTYNNTFFISRLPQLRTKSNYDPFSGKYLGSKLTNLSEEFNDFFN